MSKDIPQKQEKGQCVMRVSFNKMNIEALRFLLARRDELGKTFKDVFKDTVSYRYQESLFEEPYAFTAYHVLQKLKKDCVEFFGCEDWFLYLSDKDLESKLLSALSLQSVLDPEVDLPDKNKALEHISKRTYKFRLMYSVYRVSDEVKANEILMGNTL